jgi:hypothetical protein
MRRKLEPLSAERPYRYRTCKRPTPMGGTKRCDGCWEVESRLERYLIDGGAVARKFVAAALDKSSARLLQEYIEPRRDIDGDAFDAGYNFYNETVARPNRARRKAK